MSRGSCPRKSAEIRYERLERLSAKLIKIGAVRAVQVWDFYHTFSACGSCGFRGFSGYPGSTGHWRVATSLCDTGAKLSILHIFARCILHYVVRQMVRHMILHVVHHMVWYVTRTSWRHMVSNMAPHLVSHMVCHIISRHIPSHRMHTNRRNSSDYSGPSDCIALHCIRLQHIISYAHVYAYGWKTVRAFCFFFEYCSLSWGWGGVGWGGMLTFLVLRTGYIAMLLRSLGLLTTWHVATLLRSLVWVGVGVGWGGVGGHVNVPCTSYMIYCHVAKISGIAYYVTCCYAAEISSVGWGWVGVGWGGGAC